MMNNLKSLEWWEKAGTRAIKTVAQTAVATISTAALMTEVNWTMVASASLLAGIVSLLMNIAGMPEMEKRE